MQNELTNLLPEDSKRALRRNYFLRLGIVIIVFLILLTLAGAVMLFPSYVFLAESSNAKETRLASIESTISSPEESALSARLFELSNDSKILGILTQTTPVSATIRTMLAIPRPGITLSGFVYSPSASINSNVLAISGMSLTRDALRNYQLALQSAPGVLSANLLVSVYAKDTDINFTVTVTLAPTTP